MSSVVFLSFCLLAFPFLIVYPDLSFWERDNLKQPQKRGWVCYLYLFTCFHLFTYHEEFIIAWCHSKHYLHLKIAFAKRSIHDYDVFSTFIILFWPLRSSNHSLSLTCHIQCFDLPIIRFPVNTRRVWLTLHSPPSTLGKTQKWKKNVLHMGGFEFCFADWVRIFPFSMAWLEPIFVDWDLSFWPLRFFEPVCYCGP